MTVMRAYCGFCQDYYDRTGYRCDLVSVGYRVAKDTSSLFSYSREGFVMTLDPACTATEDGWDDYLRAFNQFCIEHKGMPLFNQTKWLTPQQVRQAFAEKLTIFEHYRKQYDPQDRLLNGYFKQLLAPVSDS